MDNINDELISERIKPYKVSDFNNFQIYEIYIGLREGLDVTSYADPKYNDGQMEQIRVGLKKGLDVTAYADPKYDEDQMCEIRKGLEQGLDVSAYVDPKFNDNQMREIRWGLKSGLDISVYADPKFSSKQMEEIREGLEEGLDVTAYANPKFNFFQMYDIRRGLEKGLDVKAYADPKFNADQMEQILFGLEAGLDVSIYTDTKFDKDQMFEIRKGLEDGLDVTKYANPKFNDFQMYEIRKDLEHTANQNNDEELDESKKIVESNNEIQKVTPEKLSEIIENMKDDKYYGRFYAKEGDMFVAVDNTTANAWTEEFNTEKDALLWLENTDMTREELGNDLEEKEKHSEELQNIDKNYQLKNGDYFHFHTNEEGYYYTIYDKFGFEQDGGLLEYSDNEENETLMSIRKRLAEFTDIEELADVNLQEVSQEDMDYITSGQKTEERKASSEDEEEDER